MKKIKKKVYVTAIGNGIAIAAKAVLSEEQFKKASSNKERVAYLLCGTNAELWFIDESKKPYNLGIRSIACGTVSSSEAIAKEEENVKNILDQLIEQIDKFPEQSEEAEEAIAVSADDHEEFFKSLAKDVEGSLKQHFGKDVEYTLLAHSDNHLCIDSTISPLEIIHMMAFATAHQK